MRHDFLDLPKVDALPFIHHQDFVVKIKYFLAGLVLSGYDTQPQCARNNTQVLSNVQRNERIEALKCG